MLDDPLLRAAFDHGPCGVAFYDRDQRFIVVNDAFAAMSGRTAAEHAGRRLDEILPRQAAQISPHLLSVFATGRATTGVALIGLRNPRAANPGHWVANYHPILANGAVTSVMAVVTDVTSQRRAEAILLTQREVLERCVCGEPLAVVLDRVTTAVTEHSVDGAIASILLVEGGRMVHCSAPYLPRAYVEAIDGQAIGPTAGSCGTAAYRGEAVFVRDIESDPLWDNYRAIARPFGLRACWSVPIVGSDGSVLGTFALYHREPLDPSEDDVALARLMSRTAAVLIEWWHGEEARRQLLAAEQEARRAAEDANRGKDEFVAMLSHELRTPLNAIMGWTRMLRTGPDDAALAERALLAIERNAESQARLVEDLLDIARIARGGLHLEIAPVDLPAIAHAALEAVKPLADAKGIRLLASIDTATIDLAGDANRLKQVIWNLLTNAVKFTPGNGEVHLEVRPGTNAAHLIVQDTGIGIAPEILPHVFDRYRQADASRGGLGLGLAIAASVAELHGGSLRASSDGIGRGARFELVLPASGAAVRTAGTSAV